MFGVFWYRLSDTQSSGLLLVIELATGHMQASTRERELVQNELLFLLFSGEGEGEQTLIFYGVIFMVIS